MQKMQETWVRSLGRYSPLEMEVASHSSIIAWKILRTEEPGRLRSTGSQSQTQLSDWAHTLPSLRSFSLFWFFQCKDTVKGTSWNFAIWLSLQVYWRPQCPWTTPLLPGFSLCSMGLERTWVSCRGPVKDAFVHYVMLCHLRPYVTVTVWLSCVVRRVLLRYVAHAIYHIRLLHYIVLAYRAMIAIDKNYNFVWVEDGVSVWAKWDSVRTVCIPWIVGTLFTFWVLISLVGCFEN